MYEHYPFSLMPLPYPYNGLEPYLDEQTVKLHHDGHQAAYVSKLNAALKCAPDYHTWSLEKLICNCGQLPAPLQVEVHRNAGGVYNHELYFDCMTCVPMCKRPIGKLAERIDCCFTSFEAFRDIFTQTALDRFGSGWAWLASDSAGRLQVLSTANQDTPLTRGLHPVLVVDVWEHAYYLQYKNKRADYLKAWWNLVDWQFAEENFLASF